MSTATIILPPQSAKLPSSAFPQIDGSQNRWYLLFDASTQESCQWQLRLPVNYSSGLIAKIQFAMVSVQTGTNKVDWEVSIMAVTPDDAADIETNSFDTVNTDFKTLAENQAAGYLKELSITLSNIDSAVAGDLIIIKLSRDADDVDNDTASGDAEVVNFALEYTTI